MRCGFRYVELGKIIYKLIVASPVPLLCSHSTLWICAATVILPLIRLSAVFPIAPGLTCSLQFTVEVWMICLMWNAEYQMLAVLPLSNTSSSTINNVQPWPGKWEPGDLSTGKPEDANGKEGWG